MDAKIENANYDFIGRLANALFGQGIKMSYSTLMQLLVENGLDSYGSERGMARGIAAAYHRWKEAESNCKIPSTSGAIANTFVNKAGYPSWLDTEPKSEEEEA